MMRVWSTGFGQLGRMGPKLRKDGWWMATVAGLAAYLVLQATTLGAAALLFYGRATSQCAWGPECGLVAGWSDGWVGVVSLVGATISIVVIGGLWKLWRAVVARLFWTPMVVRGTGWATAFVGLLAVLGWGLPWLIVGLWLAITAKRMQPVMEWPAGFDPQMGGQGARPERDEGPVHTIHIDEDPIDPDDIVDVQFEDKKKG